ncbi:MAG: TetR/AcrR family transcriptional regulator, partial [Xanthomonadales bacterium]|nr:TetR/AcrR family transcriptional regulator [Xanthomonadales bacterium]
MPRRDTRELILSTSLALFNQLGEPNVTTNLIADEAEISPGNLYYHFRQKQDIVEALFGRLAEALLPLVEIDSETALDAESLWFRLHMIFEVKGQYRFVYRNLSDLSERMPRVGKAMRALFERERTGVSALLEALQAREFMDTDKRQRAMLADQLMLTMTYWIPFANLFDPEGAEDGSAQVRAIARVFLL